MASRSDLCASKHMAALTDMGGSGRRPGQTSLLYIPMEIRGVQGNHQHQVTGPARGHCTELTEKASEAQRRDGGRRKACPLGSLESSGDRISGRR